MSPQTVNFHGISVRLESDCGVTSDFTHRAFQDGMHIGILRSPKIC